MRRLMIAGLVAVAALPAAAAAQAKAPKHKAPSYEVPTYKIPTTYKAPKQATARFTATLEAERNVTWEQPRGVNLKDCKGDHWMQARGGENWKLKTGRSFPIKVTRYGGMVTWQVGPEKPSSDPRERGVEAAGMIKREADIRMGQTGGWCGSEGESKLDNDCGTKLPTWLVNFSAGDGKLGWYVQHAPWTANEKLDFYNCTLNVPDGLSVGSFPDLVGKYKTSDLFGGKREITIKAGKKYGPDSHGVPNFGVEATESGEASWTLKLVRRK